MAHRKILGGHDHMYAANEKNARLYVFARFHAKSGLERGVEQEIMKVLAPTRAEPECLGVNMFRSVRDERLFYIHSKWQSEAGFDWHGEQPHTKEFIEAVAGLIDHSLDVVRTRLVD